MTRKVKSNFKKAKRGFWAVDILTTNVTQWKEINEERCKESERRRRMQKNEPKRREKVFSA